MKNFIFLVILLLVSSCARIPLYGSNRVSPMGCSVGEKNEVECYSVPGTLSNNRAYEMSPIEKLGLPSPPSDE